ncbi:hypothetical protein MTO96_013259 [Rhipicephalus appendiculatus]
MTPFDGEWLSRTSNEDRYYGSYQEARKVFRRESTSSTARVQSGELKSRTRRENKKNGERKKKRKSAAALHEKNGSKNVECKPRGSKSHLLGRTNARWAGRSR